MTRPRRAFTLLELIVSIGILALLASLVIAALGGVRSAANRAESSNALRNMALGFSAYSSDHRQRFMPGAIAPDEFDAGGAFAGTKVSVADGVVLDFQTPSGREDASSYVWRLAPYLDHAWKTMFTDYRSKELMERLDAEFIDGVYGHGSGPGDLGISWTPSFGMNSIYVGGDAVHGSEEVLARNPWNPTVPGDVLAATRLTEVRNPARLVVFAPCVWWGEKVGDCDSRRGQTSEVDPLFADPPVQGVDFGYAELRPPSIEISDGVELTQWTVCGDNLIGTDNTNEFPTGGGWPIARWSDGEVPIAHVDGSVETKALLDLERDMRYWWPKATGY